MDTETRDTITGFWFLCAVVAVMWACVRGCGIVNDPATIKAEADAFCLKSPKYCTADRHE